MLPLCLELNFQNGIFLERIFWSFLEMSHVKQDHQWAVGSSLSGASLETEWGMGRQNGKRNKNRERESRTGQWAHIPVLETGPRLRIYSNGSSIMRGRGEVGPAGKAMGMSPENLLAP